MYLQYYTPLATRINALSNIQSVDWFNNQYERTEELKAIKYPAVFVDFESPTVWTTQGKGLQIGLAQISFHVVVNNLNTEPDLADQRADDVHKELQDSVISNSDGVVLSSRLSRVESEIILTFDQIKVIKITYSCELQDRSTMACESEVTTVSLNTTWGTP